MFILFFHANNINTDVIDKLYFTVVHISHQDVMRKEKMRVHIELMRLNLVKNYEENVEGIK